MVWNRMIEEVMDSIRNDTVSKGVFSPLEKPVDGGGEGAEGFERLEWGYGSEVVEELKKAKGAVKEDGDGCDSKFLDFNDFGKEEIKTWKVRRLERATGKALLCLLVLPSYPPTSHPRCPPTQPSRCPTSSPTPPSTPVPPPQPTSPVQPVTTTGVEPRPLEALVPRAVSLLIS